MLADVENRTRYRGRYETDRLLHVERHTNRDHEEHESFNISFMCIVVRRCLVFFSVSYFESTISIIRVKPESVAAEKYDV